MRGALLQRSWRRDATFCMLGKPILRQTRPWSPNPLGLLLFFLLMLLGSPARAEVWGYIDERGVAHFAPSKLDARYELFFKDGQGFNTKDGLSKDGPSKEAVKAEAIDIPRPVAVPAAAAKLIAFFEVSNNFKAVRHHMREAAATHNIDFELLQAMISAESGFDPNAVSPKGAVGLMQLMPTTAQRYGVQADKGKTIEKKLVDPKTNIAAGTKYLRDLLNLFQGRLDLAIAAYNAGEGAVQRAGNKVPNYKETQDYVKTVLQLYTWLKPPAPVVEARLLEARAAQEKVTPARIRLEQIGGAAGRGNMVASVGDARNLLQPLPATTDTPSATHATSSTHSSPQPTKPAASSPAPFFF